MQVNYQGDTWRETHVTKLRECPEERVFLIKATENVYENGLKRAHQRLILCYLRFV